MPRSSRGSRPAPKTQSRGHATMAAPAPRPMAAPVPPAAAAAKAPATSQGGGFLANMAATAGGVAIGSTVGHGLSNMLFGGGSDAAAHPEAVSQRMPTECDFQIKEFTKCLETSDVNGCNWFLEQLKSCQAAYAPRQ